MILVLLFSLFSIVIGKHFEFDLTKNTRDVIRLVCGDTCNNERVFRFEGFSSDERRQDQARLTVTLNVAPQIAGAYSVANFKKYFQEFLVTVVLPDGSTYNSKAICSTEFVSSVQDAQAGMLARGDNATLKFTGYEADRSRVSLTISGSISHSKFLGNGTVVDRHDTFSVAVKQYIDQGSVDPTPGPGYHPFVCPYAQPDKPFPGGTTALIVFVVVGLLASVGLFVHRTYGARKRTSNIQRA